VSTQIHTDSCTCRQPVTLFTLDEIPNILRSRGLNCSFLDRCEANGSRGIYSAAVETVAVDSRMIEKNALFIALEGTHADGHEYIDDAFLNGAAGAVVSRKNLFRVLPSAIARWGNRLIMADDSLRALHILAEAWVERCSIPFRAAVSGSSGKTTAKELTASILSSAAPGKTVKNFGNFNSVIGLPLSLFSARPDDTYAVFEMGIDHPGEMEQMVRMLKPNYGIITNIGNAHLSTMGSQKTIAEEKSLIFTPDTAGGYIDGENIWRPHIEELRNISLKPYDALFHTEDRNLFSFRPLGLNGWKIRYRNRDIHFSLIGEHNLKNALAAVRISEDLGVSADDIKRGLERAHPLFGRSRVIHGPVTIIEDCYNANDASMNSMLAYISSLKWKGRVALVLGDMKELGAVSSLSHRQIGAAIQFLGPAAVFLYGESMTHTYNSLKAGSFNRPLLLTDNYAELEQAVADFRQAGDLFLVKASRVMGLERVVEMLKAA